MLSLAKMTKMTQLSQYYSKIKSVIINHQFVQFAMKEQSESSFNAGQRQISPNQLIELTHYGLVLKNTSKLRLCITDYDINPHQTSDYYVRKRRGNIMPITQESQKAEENKMAKKSKVENVKKGSQITVNQSKLSVDLNLPEITVNAINSKIAKQIIEPDKQSIKSSRKKIQVIQVKNKNEFDNKQSFQTLKQFQKDYLGQYSNELNLASQEKVSLSQFMQGKKSQKDINVSKKPKTERSNPINKEDIEENHSVLVQQNSPRQESSKIQKSIYDGGSSKVYVLPENFGNHSKSKSKTKFKKPKESSFIKKHSLKKTYAQQLPKTLVHQIKQHHNLYNYSAPVSKSNGLQAKEKHYDKPHRRINLKCEDIIPTQDFEGEPMTSQLAEYNHREELQQFPQVKMVAHTQKVIKQELDHSIIQNNYSPMDYFEIDIRPLNKKPKKQQQLQQSPNPPTISPNLQSQLKASDYFKQKKIEKLEEDKVDSLKDTQQQNPPKNAKSSRRKIFQESAVKQLPDKSEDISILLSSLSDEQMKLLLGGRGNKYKQAIILQYIKQNRKCKAI